MRRARLIGIEGRTICEVMVEEGAREILVTDDAGRHIRYEDPIEPFARSTIQIIKYEREFETDGGTLIFRRTTPIWED